MKIFANKFLILGTIVLLLVSIPLTLFLIKKQQEVRSQATASSRLYLNPENISASTQCSTFAMDVMVDPGSNLVSIVDFTLKYDPTALEITSIKEGEAFPIVKAGTPVLSSGEANISVAIGSDITKSIQTITKVATVTFKPKVAGSTQVTFDTGKSQILSTKDPQDGVAENVLSTASPASITVTDGACTITPSVPVNLTPGVTSGVTPGVTGGPGGGASGAPTPTTTATNKAPTCNDLTVSPSATGSAPFSVMFTAKGSDADTGGLIVKTSFSFGDGGQIQDVTAGMNLQTVTAQTSHTYTTGGTFNATATFTDDKSAISATCSKAITVTASAAATLAPTLAITSAPPTLAATAIPTNVAPTIPPTGSTGKTIGIIGAVVLTIIGGFFLLAL